MQTIFHFLAGGAKKGGGWREETKKEIDELKNYARPKQENIQPALRNIEYYYANNRCHW